MPKARTIEDMSAPNWTDFLAQGAIGPGDVQPAMRDIASAIGGIPKSIADLMERATHSAGDLQRTGDVYNPEPVLGAAMLGPMASLPMALRGKMDPNLLATLYLRRMHEPELQALGKQRFQMVNEGGDYMGMLKTKYNPKTDNIHVESIKTSQTSPLGQESVARQSNTNAHAIGPRDVRSLFMGLRQAYPEAQTISGYRVSGGREAAKSIDELGSVLPGGEFANAQARMPRFTDEQLSTYLAGKPPAPPASGTYRAQALPQGSSGPAPTAPQYFMQGMTESQMERLGMAPHEIQRVLNARVAAQSRPPTGRIPPDQLSAMADQMATEQMTRLGMTPEEIQQHFRNIRGTPSRTQPDPAAEAALEAIMRALRTD